MEIVKLRVCQELILVEKVKLLEKSDFFKILLDGPFLKADVDGVIELKEQDVKTFKNLIHYVRKDNVPKHGLCSIHDFSMLNEMASFYLIDLPSPVPKLLHHYRRISKDSNGFSDDSKYCLSVQEYENYLNAGKNRWIQHQFKVGPFNMAIILNEDDENVSLERYGNYKITFSLDIMSDKTIDEMEAIYSGFMDKFREIEWN